MAKNIGDGGWPMNWFKDRFEDAFLSNSFSGNFSLSESEPETVEVSSLGELKAVDEVLDNDWQLQSSVGLLATARGHLPGGAHFLQRAALADAAWPGRLPSLEQKLPAILVFVRTPRLTHLSSSSPNDRRIWAEWRLDTSFVQYGPRATRYKICNAQLLRPAVRFGVHQRAIW